MLELDISLVEYNDFSGFKVGTQAQGLAATVLFPVHAIGHQLYRDRIKRMSKVGIQQRNHMAPWRVRPASGIDTMLLRKVRDHDGADVPSVLLFYPQILRKNLLFKCYGLTVISFRLISYKILTTNHNEGITP